MMYRQDRTQSRDGQKTDERLYYKFITSYVEGTYRKIYKDAVQLFNQAKRENPGVRDLTKTDTFMREVYPNAPIPRYYLSRKLKTSPPTQPKPQTQLVLNIPLLAARELTQSFPSTEVSTQPEAASSAPGVCTQSSPPTEVSTQPEAASSPPGVCTQSSPPTEVSTQPEAASSAPGVCTQSLPPLFLTPELYQEVLNELNKDPEVLKYLNDFSIEDDDNMNDTVVEDMGDMFYDYTSTPLEMELAAVDC